MLTADDGFRIAQKLGAAPVEARKHTRVAVLVDGQYVGSYGIQRGSRQLDHSYIARQIGLSGRDARDLSLCPMSVEQYREKLRQSGKLTNKSPT